MPPFCCCFPCFGRSQEDEEQERHQPIYVEQHPPRLIRCRPKSIMTSYTTQPKSKVKTYGKKTTKFPVVSKIFTKQDEDKKETATEEASPTETNPAPRDPLSEITETLGNIQITFPSVDSPSAWVDPDDIRQTRETRSSGKSNNTVLKVNETSSHLNLPSLKENLKGEVGVAEANSPLRSHIRLVSTDSSANKSSSSSKIPRDVQGKLNGLQLRPKSLNSQVSEDGASIGSETPIISKGKAKEERHEDPESESPPISLRSLASRRSSARKFLLDESRCLDNEQNEGSSSGDQLKETPKTPRPARSVSDQPKTLLTPIPSDVYPGHISWLRPLPEAYNSGPRSSTMTIQQWDSLLEDVDSITKIAEASFAEVYRVQVANESSILKIITLKPPHGPGSKRYSAMPVPDVLSEFQIMDSMSDLNGFLELKDAHLIMGKPILLVNAHDEFREKASKSDPDREWYFPHPKSYQKETLFLVMEMADAGQDLGSFKITGLVQIFDFFLQITLALDAGERYFGFEHRDLHENNICLRRRNGDPGKKDEDNTSDRYKLNESGYEATILDFTLSRAKIGNDKIAFYDLENDTSIFEGQGIPQYDVYRNMRAHLQSTTTTQSWSEYIPYTNFLWLQFLLGYMTDIYENFGTAARVDKSMKRLGGRRLQEHEMRKSEMKQLQYAMGWDEMEETGDFQCASDIVEWVMEKGWINAEDRL